MSRRLAIALVVAALVAAGCGSSGHSSTTKTAPTTTTPTTAAGPSKLTPFTGYGPYAVGEETLALADGRRVVVWYPADPAKAKGLPYENFDIASLLRPDLQAKIPAKERPPFTLHDHPGAAPDTKGGPYPIVLFSHGYGGFPEQSATLTTHIASWGFVVAAPDHVERSLSGLLGNAAKGVKPLTDSQVLEQTLTLVRSDAQRAKSPIFHLVIPDKAAVIGHSSGASAAYELAAADPEISSFISYAVEEPKGMPVPKVPGMVMTGTTDGVIPPAHDRIVYDGMRSPKYFVQIGNAGHLVFSDICLIGRSGGGIVAIGERLGLPIQMFAKLGTDGCKAKDLRPEKAFPAIDDLSVDFLRWTLGVEKAPVGLDSPDIGAQFKTATITVTADH
jgi:dienelactone hydrolase